MVKNKPVKKFSAGLIQVTVWKNNGAANNEGKQFDFYSVQLQRRYKDKQGEWKSSSSLRVNEIPKGLILLQKAYEFHAMSNTENQQPASEASQAEEIVM